MELEKFVRENLTKRYIKLKEEQRNDYILKAKEGDKKSREIVFQSVYPYIIRIAIKYSDNNIPISALINCSIFGVNEAIDKFNVDRGYYFITFVDFYIKKYIRDEICNHSKTVRMPTATYFAQKRRNAEITGIAMSSLNLQSNDGNSEIIDTIKGENDNTLENLLNIELSNKLKSILSNTEREIIKYRFESNLTLKDTSDIMGVSRERIRQIEVIAINRMRKYYRTLISKEAKCTH